MLAAVAVAGVMAAMAGAPGAVAAVVVAPAAGFVAARAIARLPGRGDPALPLALDLVAAALDAGQPLPRALDLAAGALAAPTADEFARVARLLALGSTPRDAWRGVQPELLPVAAAACRSEHSGARLARNLTDLAADLRAEARARALGRAHRAGVLALLPLGLCFLPAFVCLGIVPSVAGLLSGVMAGGP